jgi:GTP-binding protein HflX
MSDSPPVPLRAAVVAVHLPGVDDKAFAASLAELHRLGRTLGVAVVATVTQRRQSLHPAAVLGSGKLAELQALAGRTPGQDAGDGQEKAAEEEDEEDDDDEEEDEEDEKEDAGDDAEKEDDEEEDEEDEDDEEEDEDEDEGGPDKPEVAPRRSHHDNLKTAGAKRAGAEASGPPAASPIEAVLVDHDISPSQARNLEKATGVEVLDRTAVILEIFRRHARSRAAKAQVEIVRLQYMVPRLREQGKGKDRQRGGIGGKGAGESSLELDRRKIRDRIAELTRELDALAEEQRTQRARRRDMSRVALVGYTNAGKSTLMRALTGSEVVVADRLFATLDTTVRPLVPETRPRVLLSDTVGFIDKLPHGLVASFKSTLDEALEAGLLAQVIDASDPNFERQLQVTTEVLTEIGAGDVPRLLVFNKIDRVGGPEAEETTTRALLERWPDAVVLSARRPADVTRLHARLVWFFSRDLVEGEVRVPYDRQQMRGEIFAACEVLGESYNDDGVVFRVRARPDMLERLQAA